MLNLIDTIEDIEEDTKELINDELKKVFGKHIEDIIEDLINDNIENVKKTLDVTDENEAKQLEHLMKVYNDIKICQRKGKQNLDPPEINAIANNILQVF